MKKKRNLLTIISSILGVFAICGFSMLSIFHRSDEKTQFVSAAAPLVLTNVAGQGNFSYEIEYDEYEPWYEGDEFFCVYNYDISYTQNFASYTAVSYRISVALEYYFYWYSNEWENTLYLYQRQYENEFTYSGLVYNSTSQFASGTPFTMSCSALEFTYTQNYGTAIDMSFFISIQNISYPFSTHVDGADVYLFNSVDYIGSVGDFEYLNDSSFTNQLMVSSEIVYALSEYEQGFDAGYNEGYTNGYTGGYHDGHDAGYQEGYDAGSAYSYDLGYTDGYNAGNDSGYANGYLQGKQEAEAAATVQIENAYQSGYSDGYNEADSQDAVVQTIFSGILQVALVPINFFLAIFNFEILGINLSAFIRAIFTVVLTIIVIKTVMGKGGGGSDN